MLLCNILKEIFDEAGHGIPLQNYWLDKKGDAVKVNHHEWYARRTSGFITDSGAYEWMYNRKWARIIIDNEGIYIDTGDSQEVHLTPAQKDWVLDTVQSYP